MRHSKRIKAEIVKKERKRQKRLQMMGFPIFMHPSQLEQYQERLKAYGYFG